MTEYSYRWIRTHLRGVPEERHVKQMEAQGWEPVPPDELPPPVKEPDGHWKLPDLLDPHAFGVEYGDLRYYRMPVEMMAERTAHFTERARRSLKTAEDAWLRDNDPRMPKFVEVETDRTWNEGRGPDRPNVPPVTAAEYYSDAAIAEHPERAAELAGYHTNLKANGTSIPLLQQAIDERRAKARPLPE